MAGTIRFVLVVSFVRHHSSVRPWMSRLSELLKKVLKHLAEERRPPLH